MKKLLYGILISGLLFLSVAGIGYLYAKSHDFFFPQINLLLKESAGFEFEKDGALELVLLPRLKLTAHNLRINSPSSPAGAQFLKTEHLSLTVGWLSILRLALVIDIDLHTTEIDLQIDEAGSANWLSSKLQGERTEFPVKFGNIDARKTRFRYRNNQTQEILGLDIDQISIDLVNGQANTHVSTAARFGKTRFFALGELKYEAKNKQLDLDLAVSAGAAGDKKVATIAEASISDWIGQNAELFPLNGTLKGSLSFKDTLPYGMLNFEAEARAIGDFSYLNENLEHLSNALGPIVASGVLQLNGSDLDIKDLQAELHHQGQSDIKLDGAIQNLLSEPHANLNVDIQASRLDRIFISSPVAAIDQALISRLESVRFNASININGSGIRIGDMDLHFSQHGLDAGVTGEIDVTKESILTNLRVDGKADNAGDLLGLFGIEIAPPNDFGPLTISAIISSENDRYLIEQSALHSTDGGITMATSGRFNTTDSGLSFDLSSSLEVKDLFRLAEISPENLQPYLHGISGSASAKINGTLEDFSISNAKMDLFHGDSTLHLEGRLSQLPGNLISDINVRYLTGKPIDLEPYFPKLAGFQLTGPLDLSANMRTIDTKIFVQRIRLQAKQTDVEGEVIIDLGRSPSRISATLNSEQFITSLVEDESEGVIPVVEEVASETPPQADRSAEQELSAKELGERFKAYTSGIKIQTDWVDQLDIYFSYTAVKAQIGDYTADNLAVIVNARKGIFELVKYQLELDDRPIFFSGLINANMTPPKYEFVGELKGDTLETLLNVEGDLLEGGELSGNFALKSEGDNIGQLIENLNGNALVTMGPLTIRSDALNFVSSSIFSAMLGGVMRNKDAESASAYECGVLGVDIDKGVVRVNKAFTMQARDYNLAGNGTIDLNTGAVDLSVNPKARKGIGLSISTIIGGFKIKGYMATPDFAAGGGGLISAVVVGYALAPVLLAGAASNPLTASIVASGFLLTGIADRMTASNYTCENTLKRIERNRSKALAPPEPEIQY